MIQIKSKLRRWGNSLGIVVPQQSIANEKIKEGDEVTILIKTNKDNVLKEMFGTFRFKKPVERLMKGVDVELENE